MLDRVRLDAYEKATGRAKYTDDLEFDGMLYAAVAHSTRAHAEIVSIDLDAARSVPGVVGVYTARDVPGRNAEPQDKPILADRAVKCIGDGVALVAAESEEIARRAAELVKVEYKDLPAVFDLRTAARDGSPLVHPETGTNIFYTHQIEKGRVDDGFAEADVIIEHTFTTPRYHHGAIETDAAITVPNDGRMTVYCASKGAFAIRASVASSLGMDPKDVRIVHAAIGGTFGGKQHDTALLAGRAGMVSVLTGRPCKVVWTREETMTEGTKRHPFVVTYKIGAKRDGRLTAMKVDGLADGGAYRSRSQGVVRRAAVECSGPYLIPNVSIDLRAVFTNSVYCDAVRGFGSPQVFFALESSMTILAERLGISPMEIRRMNALCDGDVFATGQTMKCVGIRACLDRLEEMCECEPLRGAVEGGKARGRGIACQIRGESHGSGAKDECGVDITVERDGTIVVSTGITEMGQGTHTGLASAACEMLGLEWSRFRAADVDTDVSPFATPTTASRGTISGANATYLAVQDLLDSMCSAAAERAGADHAAYSNGRFYGKNGGELATFDETAAFMHERGMRPIGRGRWIAPATDWDYDKKCGNAFYSYSYGAAAAEVEVDLVTGRVDVLRLDCLHDAGRVLNRSGADGQIEGGLVMSLGHATSEELAISDGRVLTDNFDTYLMPTSLDVRELNAEAAELVPNDTPTGTHGVAEGATVLSAAVIANAVADALGVRIFDLPLSLERVRSAIEEMHG